MTLPTVYDSTTGKITLIKGNDYSSDGSRVIEIDVGTPFGFSDVSSDTGTFTATNVRDPSITFTGTATPNNSNDPKTLDITFSADDLDVITGAYTYNAKIVRNSSGDEITVAIGDLIVKN